MRGVGWEPAAPGSGEEPRLVALVLTGNQEPHLPSHLSVPTLLLSPHPSAATSERSRGDGAGVAASRRGKAALGRGESPGSPTASPADAWGGEAAAPVVL